MIAINGISLPAPSVLWVKTERRAGNAEYNSLGRMVQDGMVEKRVIEMKWARLSCAALQEMAALLEGAVFLTLSYPDPLLGNREIEGWIAEKNARVWKYDQGAAAWADVKLVVEER